MIGEDSGGHKADHPGDEAADDPHDPDGAQEQVQDDRSTEEVLRYIFDDHEAADDPDGAQEKVQDDTALEEELPGDEGQDVRIHIIVSQCSRGYWVKMDKLQGYFGGEHGLSIKYLDQSRRGYRSPAWILLRV